MIKLIIFDAGGVLYKGSEKIVNDDVRKFLKKHGVSNFEKSDEVWFVLEKLAFVGKISAKEAHKRWLEGVGLSRNLIDEWAEVDKKGKMG